MAALMLNSGALQAEVRMPRVLGSHMVLQREMATPLWGWAAPGEEVTVSLADLKLPVVQAGADGKWMVRLPAQPAGGPVTITVQGRNKLVLEDVLFGDVWLCAGQSNMHLSLADSSDGSQAAAAANHPAIRLLAIPQVVADDPQDDCPAQWSPCNAQTAGSFSAVGYYFGRGLHEAVGVPIGLVQASWSGTPAEAWTPMFTLEADPAFRGILQRGKSAQARFARRADETQPNKLPVTLDMRAKLPAVLYNAKIHPLIPMGIKGVLWYQGGANMSRAYQYRTLLPALIQSWREAWGQGDFPFGIVQLTSRMARTDQPRDDALAETREAQVLTVQQVPRCGLIATIDLNAGETAEAHPKEKRELSRRAVLWALGDVYGRDVSYRAPQYESMQVQGGAIRVSFQHTAGGLTAQDGGKVKGFAIAGSDRRFVWAEARIDGTGVVVQSDQVPQPVAVRYAWGCNPDCSLFNSAGLPAVPFRTDDWPGITAKTR